MGASARAELALIHSLNKTDLVLCPNAARSGEWPKDPPPEFCAKTIAHRQDNWEVLHGAQDRASPNFMGLASFGLDIGTFCDFLHRVLLLDAILGLDFLGLALSRLQVPPLGQL